MPIGEFFAQNFQLHDPKAVAALAASSAPRYVKQGELILRQGEIQNEVPFLVNGIIRGFYFDINGKEITDCLVVKPGFPAVAMAEMGKPSPIYLEALEDSSFLVISMHDVQRLLEEYPVLLWLYNQLLASAFSIHWELKTALCRNTAMQRYQWFLKNYPGLIERISNKCIASFLGMTPVTLSRLRRALREQEAQ